MPTGLTATEIEAVKEATRAARACAPINSELGRSVVSRRDARGDKLALANREVITHFGPSDPCRDSSKS